MRTFKIALDDEAVSALWAEARRELDVLVASGRIPDGLVECYRGLFLHILANFAPDCIECVADSALGASKAVLRFGLSRAFKRALAASALDFASIWNGHDSFSVQAPGANEALH